MPRARLLPDGPREYPRAQHRHRHRADGLPRRPREDARPGLNERVAVIALPHLVDVAPHEADRFAHDARFTLEPVAERVLDADEREALAVTSGALEHLHIRLSF